MKDDGRSYTQPWLQNLAGLIVRLLVNQFLVVESSPVDEQLSCLCTILFSSLLSVSFGNCGDRAASAWVWLCNQCWWNLGLIGWRDIVGRTDSVLGARWRGARY